MTRIVTTAAVISLLTLFIIGCEANTGTSQKLPYRSNPAMSEPNKPLAKPTSNDEIDLIEKMAANRQAYRRSLEGLIQYYDAAGNHDKVTWARQELTALDRIPQYRYIIEADVMPANLKASESIAAADQLYEEATKVERQVAKSAAALLLEARIGERFDSIVTGASEKGTWVRLLTVPVEGKLVQGFEGADVGDRLQVQLISVDVQRGFIDLKKVHPSDR